MEVVLLEDVKALGKKGQIVKVNDGYARNFILPKKLGVEANTKNLNDLKLQKANEAKVAAEQLAEAKALAAKIDELSVTVSIKAGEGGRTFGSVSTKEIAKAAADQFGRAYFRTYGLPVVTVRCTNNYGPRQYPEKLLPFMLTRALAGKTLPVYGDGEQIRDWIHVHDFCRALRMILEKAAPGDIYNVGASNEMSNLKFLQSAMSVLDELSPRDDGRPHADAIVHVHDRPGHDRRYALDAGRLRQTLEWKPMIPFDEGLRATVRWYLKQCVSAF